MIIIYLNQKKLTKILLRKNEKRYQLESRSNRDRIAKIDRKNIMEIRKKGNPESKFMN